MSGTIDERRIPMIIRPGYGSGDDMDTERVNQVEVDRHNKLQDLAMEIYENTTTGFYRYIEDIPDLHLFSYLVIIFISILLVSKFNIRLSHFVGLVLGIIIAYFLNDKYIATNVDEYKRTELQLESLIPRPVYFYMDSNIIELMYNLLEFRQFSIRDYDETIFAIDDLLKLRLDVERGVDDCSHYVIVAKEQRQKAIDHLSAMLIATPGNHILQAKLTEGIEILRLFLQHHIYFMEDMCAQQLTDEGNKMQAKMVQSHYLYTPHDTDLIDRLQRFVR
jgi:hypothetical protein